MLIQYRAHRFYGVLNSLGLYNKNAKILFLVSVLPNICSDAVLSFCLTWWLLVGPRQCWQDNPDAHAEG